VNSTVNLLFRYVQNDYVRAVRAHYATPLRLRFDAVAIIVVGALGIYLWPSSRDHLMGVICVTASLGLTLLLAVAFILIPPMVFRSNPKFRDEYALTFSPEGIRFRTVHIDSQLQWSLYTRALIDENSYVLYYGTRDFTVIPKRIFSSAEQQEVFDDLLTQHVSEVVRRTK